MHLKFYFNTNTSLYLKSPTMQMAKTMNATDCKTKQLTVLLHVPTPMCECHVGGSKTLISHRLNCGPISHA